jgi:excisionase family DNA binding protein
MHDEYLTTTQAAKLLKVSRFSVLNWVKQGKLRSIATHGGHQRIPKKTIIDFLRRNGMSDDGHVVDNSDKVQVRCWQAKEAQASGHHRCADCLVFKEQINRCFLTIRTFGNQKIQCNTDCLNCDYFAKYFPRERKIISSIRQAAVTKLASTFPRADRAEMQNFMQKSLFISGKYFAKAKKKFSKFKIKKSSHEKNG